MSKFLEWRVWGIGNWWGNRREGDHSGDLGVDGWINQKGFLDVTYHIIRAHFIRVLTGPAGHLASCAVGNQFFPVVKAVGAWCCPLASDAEVKNEWRSTSTVSPGLHRVDKENFTFNDFVHAGFCPYLNPFIACHNMPAFTARNC